MALKHALQNLPSYRIYIFIYTPISLRSIGVYLLYIYSAYLVITS